LVTIASCSVMTATGKLAASSNDSEDGMATASRWWTVVSSAYPPAHIAITRSPTARPITPDPSAATSPAASRPAITRPLAPA
jgi:hypothetical protein